MKQTLHLLVIFLLSIPLLKAQTSQTSFSPEQGEYMLWDHRIDPPPGTAMIRRLSDSSSILWVAVQPDELQKSAPLNSLWKQSPRINEFSPGDYLVKVLDTRGFNPGITWRMIYRNVLLIQIEDKSTFQKVIESNAVVFIDRVHAQPAADSPLRRHDLGVNGIRKLHHNQPALDGEGITVSVKERTIDPEDIDLMGRLFSTGFSDEFISQHATDMGTLVGGAGNTFFTGRGVADKVRLTSATFNSLFPETEAYYSGNSISVQNHSYGVGVENYYGMEAVAYDASSVTDPILLHVFSAGNSGDETASGGNYDGIEGFSNLTGTFKQGKNSIVVTAVDEELVTPVLNSKGPAFDGRIKPELSAYGGEGTSDAAALVSGATALLQEKYGISHQEDLSSSGVKSVLIASAEDIGLPGIDFINGYGNLNLPGAVEVIEQDWIVNGSITSNGTYSAQLTVPDGLSQIRVALCWTDPPANENDFKALVNDLDLKLVDPSDNEVLPWILNTFPHQDSLLLPAVRGIDDLNNIEFITLSDPDPGMYTFNISAGSLSGPQDFSIAYFMEEADQFSWIYPTGSDPQESNNFVYLRWSESYDIPSGELSVAYGTGGWTLLDPAVNLDERFLSIDLMDTVSTMVLRMTIGAQQYISDTIAITPVVQPVVGFVCDDEILLQWMEVEQAAGYELYTIQDGQAVFQQSLTDSLVVLPVSGLNGAEYFQVVPVITGGRTGIRSRAVNYLLQSAGCYITSFLALRSGDEVNLELVVGTNYELDSAWFQKMNADGIVNIPSVDLTGDSLFYSYTDSQIASGLNVYQAFVAYGDGKIAKSEKQSIRNPGNEEVRMFPHPVPAGNSFTIITEEEDTTFEILTLQGISQYLLDISGTEGVFNTIGIKPGIYLYRITKSGRILENGRLLIY